MFLVWPDAGQGRALGRQPGPGRGRGLPAAAAPGESVTLIWRFELADDWHLYWTGRNDSGYPPLIELDLPEGWVAGGLQWPAPERYVVRRETSWIMSISRNWF